MDEAFVRHYMSGIERDRLIEGGDRLELVRTLELLDQVLPPPPARVLDVGGGPGPYATRLARAGYEVRLRSITGFAARPGTAVEPMCSIATYVTDGTSCTNSEPLKIRILRPNRLHDSSRESPRNEGVPGSTPGVGYLGGAEMGFP